MEAIAHSPGFAKKAGVAQSVGKDFAAADDKAGITKTHNGVKAVGKRDTDNVVGGGGGSSAGINLGTLKGDLGTKPPPYKPFPDEAPQPKTSGSYARGGKVKSFAGGGALGNEGGVPLWPPSGGQGAGSQFPGGGNTNPGVTGDNGETSGNGGGGSGEQVVPGASSPQSSSSNPTPQSGSASNDKKQSFAYGGMIQHASYAKGGAVVNTKSGFKSNAGDFH